jgi:hypothetical protein
MGGGIDPEDVIRTDELTYYRQKKDDPKESSREPMEFLPYSRKLFSGTIEAEYYVVEKRVFPGLSDRHLSLAYLQLP